MHVDGIDAERSHPPVTHLRRPLVATNLGVRHELVRRQRAFAKQGGVVIEGRDITTVVAPDASVRILLTADERSRVARCARELHGQDDALSLTATEDEVIRRDARIMQRSRSFARRPPASTPSNSSHLSLDDTVHAVLEMVALRTGVRA